LKIARLQHVTFVHGFATARFDYIAPHSLHWLKVPQRIHCKMAYLTYNALQSSQLFHSPTSHHPTAGFTRSSSNLSLSRPLVSSSLKFCNHSFAYAAPALWNGLPKDIRQFDHPPNLPLNFTYPPLALSSRDGRPAKPLVVTANFSV